MPRPTQLHTLTVLRFVAALFIVFFHQGQLTALVNAPGWLKNIAAAGYLGVGLFFVLSGFILTYVYTQREAPIDRPRFWQARFARIYPLYVLGLLADAPFYFRSLQAGLEPPAATILAPTLLQAWFPTAALTWNAPGWSLSVESLFYLIFPFLGVVIAKIRPNFLIPCLLLSWFVLLVPPALCGFLIDGAWQATPATENAWINVLKFNPVFHLGQFFIGIFTAQIFAKRQSNKGILISTSAGIAILGVMSVSSSLPYILLQDGLLVPLFALLIYGLACIPSSFPVSKALIILGEASYALYLLHVPIWKWLESITRKLEYNLSVGVKTY